MPREVNKRATTRVGVQQQSGGNPYSVVAPGNINVSQDANRAAEALMGLTKLGTQAVAAYQIRKDQKDFAQGESDATVGKVDGKMLLKSEAYAKAREQVEAKATWAVDQRELDKHISELDLDSIADPIKAQKLLNDTINTFLQSKYDGETRPAALQYLVPKMQEYREKMLAAFADDQRQKVEDQIDGDLVTYWSSEYDNYTVAKRTDPTATFDYEGMHDDVAALRDGRQINEVMFSILKDEAIRNGDPSLLLNIPLKWKNGMDTFTQIPDYKDAVRDAIFAAQRQAETNESAARKVIEEAEKEALRVQGVNIATAIVNNQDPTTLVKDYLVMPGAKGADALGFGSGWRSARDDFEEHAGDFTAIAQMEVGIVSGEVTIDQILNAYTSDQQILGTGQKGKQELSRLVNVYTEQHRFTSGKSNSRSSIVRQEVSTAFKPTTRLGIPATPAQLQRQSDALKEFNRRTDPAGANEDPYAVADDLYEKAGMKPSEIGGTGSNESSAIDVARAVASGHGGSRELRAAGVDRVKIDEMVKAETISPKDGQVLLNKLMSK